MNDFTQEELIVMYYNFAETTFRGTNNKLNGIRKKIKSMIENYYDHECSGNGECLTKICDRCARMT